MQRTRHPPLRNKIDLADPAQVRVWAKRLGTSAESLKAVVEKAGNSVGAVTKEVELRQASHRSSPAVPVPGKDEPASA
jgi:hypothetical protein